jgi:ribosomal protein L37AE/L43A
MENGEPRRAWLLMAAGDNRGHGGNTGYDDQHDAYYSWDDQVPNHKNPRVGDPIALWDKERLLGVSVIEEIEEKRGPKLQNRCPTCTTTRIRKRKTVEPPWRCQECGDQFPTPVATIIEVNQYKARYDAAWTSLDGALGREEVMAAQKNKGEFNAIRRLDWEAFRKVLMTKDATRAVDRVTARADLSWRTPSGLNVELTQGFSHALVRVRRGQRQFRASILAAQGKVCAFTGAAPDRVLEAGHLYSYAQLGTHFKHGGLMLRRDIHRLFDDGLLAVDPLKLRIDVAADLAEYPQYERLHDEHLTVPLNDAHIDWLGKHWDEHRATRAFSGQLSLNRRH